MTVFSRATGAAALTALQIAIGSASQPNNSSAESPTLPQTRRIGDGAGPPRLLVPPLPNFCALPVAPAPQLKMESRSEPPGVSLSVAKPAREAVELAKQLASLSPAEASEQFRNFPRRAQVEQDALKILASAEDKRFPEIVLRLYKDHPGRFFFDDTVLQVAAWRNPQIFIENFSSLPDQRQALPSLFFVLIKCDAKTHQVFVESAAAKSPDVQAVLQIVSTLRTDARDVTKTYPLLDRITNPKLQSAALQVIAAQAGALDNVIGHPLAEKLPGTARLQMLEILSKRDAAAFESNLARIKDLKTPGLSEVLYSFSVTYVSQNLHVNFDDKLKSVLPHVPAFSLAWIASSLLERPDRNNYGKKLLDNPDSFQDVGEVWVMIAARCPKVFTDNFPAIEGKLQRDVKILCLEHAAAGKTLEFVCGLERDKVSTTDFKTTMKGLTPRMCELVLLGYAAGNESSGKFLAVNAALAYAERGGEDALVLLAQRQPSIVLENEKNFRSLPDGHQFVEIARAHDVLLKCARADGSMDVAKLRAMRPFEGAAEETSTRIAAHLFGKGEYKYILENAGRIAASKSGYRVVEAAAIADPRYFFATLEKF